MIYSELHNYIKKYFKGKKNYIFIDKQHIFEYLYNKLDELSTQSYLFSCLSRF